jgi:hypothetical protein
MNHTIMILGDHVKNKLEMGGCSGDQLTQKWIGQNIG